MWEALLKEKETANARAFAQSYLGDSVPSVFSTLHERGFFLRSCWERYINAFVQAIFLSSCLFSFKSKHASPHHDLLCWCWHDRSPTTAMTYYVGAVMTGALPLPWPTMLVLTWQEPYHCHDLLYMLVLTWQGALPKDLKPPDSVSRRSLPVKVTFTVRVIEPVGRQQSVLWWLSNS